MEYLNETLQICFTSKFTYCDKEPSLLPFQFMSYLPLIDLKNGFWPVVHLLYGISEWNFTNMLIIKGYILWLRIFTLTFPVHELSTLDWSEKWFLTCSSFTLWNIWMKLHRYVEHQRLHIFSKDRHPYLSSSWVIRPWLIWKMVFWPVVHLLYGVSEWNFTDMLTIKGYILWLRTSYHCLSQFCCFLGIIYLTK